jgi:hypothetical protein
VEKVHFINNLFHGYASGIDREPLFPGGAGPQIKHVVMRGNTFVGNMNASASSRTRLSLSAQFGGILQMDVRNNEFLSREGGMTNGNISFQNTVAGENAIFMDNIMPERASGNRANGIGGFGGSGTLHHESRRRDAGVDLRLEHDLPDRQLRRLSLGQIGRRKPSAALLEQGPYRRPQIAVTLDDRQ